MCLKFSNCGNPSTNGRITKKWQCVHCAVAAWHLWNDMLWHYLILNLDIIGRKKSKFSMGFTQPPTFIYLKLRKRNNLTQNTHKSDTWHIKYINHENKKSYLYYFLTNDLLEKYEYWQFSAKSKIYQNFG